MTVDTVPDLRRADAAEPLDPLAAELVVHERRSVADGVVVLTLAPPGGGVLPSWEPGAHVDLVLGDGLVRQYSLCGDPADRSSWRIAVLRDPASRGGSQYVHEQLDRGSRVEVRGPRNLFSLDPAHRYVFVAGGIGITPILPMLAAATKAGAEWTLTYGGRTRASMAFLDELAAYGDRVRIEPQDESGLLDLDALLDPPRSDTLVYCCGPEPLLDAITRACQGWGEDALRVERFAASTSQTSSKQAGEAPIRVELRRTGVVVDVPPDRSVLDVINEAGAKVTSSCEDGICGTCETAVLDGVPDHRDSVLSAQERRAGTCILPCVSRAETDYLVLDI